jgi:hypothetical protein
MRVPQVVKVAEGLVNVEKSGNTALHDPTSLDMPIVACGREDGESSSEHIRCGALGRLQEGEVVKALTQNDRRALGVSEHWWEVDKGVASSLHRDRVLGLGSVVSDDEDGGIHNLKGEEEIEMGGLSSKARCPAACPCSGGRVMVRGGKGREKVGPLGAEVLPLKLQLLILGIKL